MPLTTNLTKGSKDPYVLTIQQQLQALGFPLPRYGADGDLGNETLSAYGAFMVSQGLRPPTDAVPTSITPTGAAALQLAFDGLGIDASAVGFIDEQHNHAHTGQSKTKPTLDRLRREFKERKACV